jgi:hypothetical protein
MIYFRPLVMATLKNVGSSEERIKLFERIERFIFIAFRLNSNRTTFGSSEFYNAARELDEGVLNPDGIANRLNQKLSYAWNGDGSFRINEFFDFLFKKFKEGTGYYGWFGLRYFLYEYERSLLAGSRQKKVDWNDLLKSDRDKISIEHIYPQTETAEWATHFANIEPEHRKFYSSSLGNLLLLSQSINSSLQNDSFVEKKAAKFDSVGRKIRNGYSDGSHSEIEVSANAVWGPEEIRERGIQLLRFMETRWSIRFRNDEERKKLLFLDFESDTPDA